MLVIAFGGAGGAGESLEGLPGGTGGHGGKAQIATTVDTYTAKYGTPFFWSYLGSQGSTEHWGGKGGSATIVSSADLNTMPLSEATALLIAGAEEEAVRPPTRPTVPLVGTAPLHPVPDPSERRRPDQVSTSGDVSGGGGGGGGSYATGSTVSGSLEANIVPATNDGDGYLLIIFM